MIIWITNILFCNKELQEDKCQEVKTKTKLEINVVAPIPVDNKLAAIEIYVGNIPIHVMQWTQIYAYRYKGYELLLDIDESLLDQDMPKGFYIKYLDIIFKKCIC